ncbi:MULTISPECIES: alpha/beta fold hydrolase [Paenibacillus]|uniref:alpha/beta fold hydrolase n=1 Tax=Paenibacillus TaxID=44249 RepID=UPI0022B87D8A|nr:alpha/beta hydrolase [Paenibacillus caseinilyticus]MCZ8520381.1 alpha/beta hydrolase [Paenibacillus caseinilyticus]
MDKKTVAVRGKKTTYLDCGEPDAPAVLLLHGFPESSLLWEETAPAVQKAGYRAIAPDLPGFGQSEPFDEPSTWERYMEFISDFADTLSLEAFHLVTHDWGGPIGTRWACHHPGRIRSLFLADTLFSPDYVWHKDAQILRTPGGGEQWVSYLQNRPVFEGFMNRAIPLASEAVVNDFYALFGDPGRHRIPLELYRSGDMEKLEPYRGRLAELLPVPVTILFGEHDPYIAPALGVKLKEEELPHASYHLLPGIGHFAPLEAPAEFNAILTAHLTQV